MITNSINEKMIDQLATKMIVKLHGLNWAREKRPEAMVARKMALVATDAIGIVRCQGACYSLRSGISISEEDLVRVLKKAHELSSHKNVGVLTINIPKGVNEIRAALSSN